MLSIRRTTIVLLVLVHALSAANPAPGQTLRGEILSRTVAAQHGLYRAWFTQTEVNRARDHVTYVTLNGGWLFVQTHSGLVQILDAETGRTIWVEPIGRPQHPTLLLSVNARFVALLNGTRLHLLNRANGQTIRTEPISGVPSAGPTLTPKRLYIPMTKGPIESWALPLDDPNATTQDRELQRRQTPWRHHSAGRSPVPLLATPTHICWPTETGYLYVAQLDSRQILFRVELNDEIVAPLAYQQPSIFAVTLAGYVCAVNEKTGRITWRFSTGHPITEPPAVVGDRLYVCPTRHGMLSIDAKTGRKTWRAPGVVRFVAASRDRVYGSNASNELLILDAKSGAHLSTLPTRKLTLQLANQQTDRIYLGTKGGLLQCLHEVALTEPVDYLPQSEVESAKADEQPDVTEPGGSKPATDRASNENASRQEETPSAAPAEKNPFE